jgi:hypothetical protein
LAWHSRPWTREELQRLRAVTETAGVRLVHRFRTKSRKTEQDFEAEVAHMKDNGGGIFVINEATPTEQYRQWELLKQIVAKTQ